MPGAVAMTYFGMSITYGQFGKLIDEATSALWRLGVRHGDIVSLALPSSPECFALFYAINKIGAIACPIDVRFTPDKIAELTELTESKVLFIMNFNLKAISKARHKIKAEHIVVMRGCESFPKVVSFWFALGELFNGRRIAFLKDSRFLHWSDITKGAREDVVLYKWQPNEPQLIFQTSGTTGSTKSVLLTIENTIPTLLAIKSHTCSQPGERVLNLIPPFAFTPFLTTVHFPLCFGLQICIEPIWKAENLLDLIVKHKAQHIGIVPSVLNCIYHIDKKHLPDLSFIKTINIGGEEIAPSFERDINEFLSACGCRYCITKAYGMTETAGVVAMTPQSSDRKYEKGYSGYIIDNKMVEIVDDEICVCSTEKVLGYYKNPDATRELIRKHDDGLDWIHTGDIGYLNEHDELFVIGRKKRMLVLADGTKVFPVEIESVLTECDAIAACAVVGATDPKYPQAQLPIAFVVLKQSNNAPIGIKLAQQYCANNLPSYLQPARIEVLDDLPTAGMGKIDYQKLTEMGNK